MKGDLIERDDVLKEIWEWIANREYQYTNATHWLQKRVEAIPSAKDKADRKTEPTGYNLLPVEDEPQTCSVNGRPYDCGNCEYFRCTADEPQTERSSE